MKLIRNKMVKASRNISNGNFLKSSEKWEKDYKTYLPWKTEDLIELFWKSNDKDVKNAIKKVLKMRPHDDKFSVVESKVLKSARIIESRKAIKSGSANNPDYVGDWYGEGQINWDSVINPDDPGDLWMVKLWSGSGYNLDVYLVNASDVYDAIDTVFEWSYNNEGKNKLVFDNDFVYNDAHEMYRDSPDLFGEVTDEDDFVDRYIEEFYVANDDYSLFALEENFFVDKVPDSYKNKVNSSKKIKSGCHGKRVKKNIKSSYDDSIEIYPYNEDADPHSDEDLALSYVVEVYGDEFVNLDDNTLKEMRDMLELYFDDEAYVRDWNIMNPDYQIESIEEVGSVEDLEINDLARYFDYDAYGRTMRIGDGFYWDDDKNCWTNNSDNLD